MELTFCLGQLTISNYQYKFIICQVIEKIKKAQGNRTYWVAFATWVNWEDLREHLPANEIFK